MGFPVAGFSLAQETTFCILEGRGNKGQSCCNSEVEEGIICTLVHVAQSLICGTEATAAHQGGCSWHCSTHLWDYQSSILRKGKGPLRVVGEWNRLQGWNWHWDPSTIPDCKAEWSGRFALTCSSQGNCVGGSVDGDVSPLALPDGVPATIPLTCLTAGLMIVHLERGCFLNTAVIHTDVYVWMLTLWLFFKKYWTPLYSGDIWYHLHTCASSSADVPGISGSS